MANLIATAGMASQGTSVTVNARSLSLSSDTTDTFSDAITRYSLTSNGYVNVTANTVEPVLNSPETWRNEAGTYNEGKHSFLEVKVTRLSGVLLELGTLDTWLPITTTRTWGLRRNGGSYGISTAQLEFQIRDSRYPSVILREYMIQMYATASGGSVTPPGEF